ncbi:hypothetical protein NEMBOFW57_010434 [Staphylotrichum longicolle]|uniref:Catabolic 3-dehydroquinase n=1 Tax=Staphylotrichum longicolle TaxID=669026 RepID=A0AAD4HX01_9PEZI|nr:hypothetical protein NEMBOFW57_010434 [Staphylotrichum longicolle]
MARHILLINGPNLNLLGRREPHIYGSTTLADVESHAASQASSLGITLETFQSNHEGAIVDRIQAAAGWGPSSSSTSSSASAGETQAVKKPTAIIINPGALTHTSVAVRDALLGVDIPFVEVHVSNVHAREAFRKHSYLSDKAVAVICGMGVYGYTAAVEFAARHMKVKEEEEGQ